MCLTFPSAAACSPSHRQKAARPISSTESGSVFLGRDYAQNRDYSSQIAFEIDSEIRRIIDESYQKAKEIISEHRDALDRISSALEEKETLTADDLNDLVNPKPAEEPVPAEIPELAEMPDPDEADVKAEE